MIHCKKLLRSIALMVIFTFLFQSELFLYSTTGDELAHQFLKAKNEYINGQYIGSKNRLERLIGIINEEGLDRKDILGKCYLLLGAIYEKFEKTLLAEEYYRKAKKEYAITKIDGIDLDDFPIYGKVVKGIGIITQEGNKKKEKKFPWLLVAGGSVVFTVAAILLLKKKEETSLDVTLISPPNRSVFNHYPRTTTLEWEKVTAPGPITYLIEREYSWCEDMPEFGEWEDAGCFGQYPRVETTQSEFTFDFVGAQPGRWRVTYSDQFVH